MHQEELTRYTASFIRGLVEKGVEDIVVSPGSRSTPLAVLLDQHPGLKVWMNVDERSAAFFALGMAKKNKKPVGLVCSSGTAAANYYPAIIEAHYAEVPLIVMTADRPHELRETGAPQAIDQVKLYGSYVKSFKEMPLPDMSSRMLRFSRQMAMRGVRDAMNAPAGPVHFNFPFREPLMPDVGLEGLWKTGEKEIEVENFSRTVRSGHTGLGLSGLSRCLIVAGRKDYRAFKTAFKKLSESLNAPVIADPLSQLRSGEDYGFITSYDTFLRNSEFMDSWQPDCVIQFGAMPVSKAFTQYIEKSKPACYLLCDQSSRTHDPLHLSTAHFEGGPDDLLQLVVDEEDKQDKSWLELWQKADRLMKKHLDQENHWFEGSVFQVLKESIKSNGTLMLGNSMPIRDADTFLTHLPEGTDIYANRGANGIDGVVSTAIGLAAADPSAYLVIGDLSFYHDMNGLLAGAHHKIDVTIIVINNNGGGIFSFLPQAKTAESFEKLFGTPMELDIEAAARLYKAAYFRAENKGGLTAALKKADQAEGIKIIEAVTSREDNLALHQTLWQESGELLKSICHD